MGIRPLKIALVVLQLVPLVALVALATVTSGNHSGTPAEDDVVAGALVIVYAPMLASGVVGGILASRMKRSVLGWVLACVFLPLIGPLVLVSRKPPGELGRAREPAAVSASPAADGSGAVIGTASNPAGFCDRCLAETTDESTGNVTAVNGIGTMLMGTRWRAKGLHPCPVCGSVVQTKWATFGVGIKPLGTYRVLYTKQGLTTSRFFSRRLRCDPVR